MKQSTKKAILSEIQKYIASKGLNLQKLKSNNPLPCSPRWIDLLISSVKNQDNTNFDRNKCIKVLDFLGVKWTIEDGELVLLESTKTQPND